MSVALQVFLTYILSRPVSLLDAWDAIASARLAARMKVVKDAGDPASMAELAKRYPAPPPGQNAAEFLNPAMKIMKEQNEAVEQLADRLPIVGDGKLPDVAEPVPAPVLAGIRGYLEANAEILSLLHKAAKREDCKFDLDFAKGIAMELPHLAQLRQGARLFALEAVERTETGKADAAADSLLGALRMGECVRREPILISTFVRMACDAIAVGEMQRWASRGRPSVANLERVEVALAAAADPKIIERALVGERCFGIDIYRNQVLTPEKRGELLDLLERDVQFPIPARLFPSLYLKMDMCCYLDIMNDYVAAARKPYPESSLTGAKVGENLEQRIPRLYVVSRMMLPALSGSFVHGQKHIARCESARVALAALRYKAKHGRVPADLAALVPDFLKAVPLDPFDGKPLRYRAGPAGLTVYAVGENGKDDGGATQHPPDGKPLDVGFRVRWPKAEF